MNPNIFDNAAEAETAERFASLDALYNFRTFRFLETAGIAPGCHCREVGGGSGAVAAWMADRVGPSGYVLVTDIDPGFMERSAYRRPAHLELRRHDIGTDPLPEHAFDLIHARLVLSHVPQRRQALARLVAALKPRGWLVIDDFDGRVIDRTVSVPAAAAAALFKRVGAAPVALLEERGFEVEWGRRLFNRLKAVGLALVRGDIQDAGHCEAIIRKAERWRAAELPFTRAWPHSQTWRSSPSLACSIRRWRDRG
jgi:ubiquinone/menaquinone biosynthesis C-methylase UbiE